MNIFDLRERLITDYSAYTQSFLQIRDDRIRSYVQEKLQQGLLWPETLIQLNPSFEPGARIDELADEGVLHAGCRTYSGSSRTILSEGRPLRLHRHQEEAVRVARGREQLRPDDRHRFGQEPVLHRPGRRPRPALGSGRGIQAIVVYPMNALANSQMGELEKFLARLPRRPGPVTLPRYTGQENEEERQEIVTNPPDILLTNYVMLE